MIKMKTTRCTQQMMVSLAILSMTLAQPAAAAQVGAPPAASKISDVALLDGGIFHGKVTTRDGTPVGQTIVSLSQAGREVARVQTGRDGLFQVVGLRGGVYQVTTNGNTGVYRFWNQDSAPPAAQPGAMLITSDAVVRGQCGGQCGPAACTAPCGPRCGPRCFPFPRPLIVGGIIAAAIAVPIAVSGDDDSDSGS